MKASSETKYIHHRWEGVASGDLRVHGANRRIAYISSQWPISHHNGSCRRHDAVRPILNESTDLPVVPYGDAVYNPFAAAIRETNTLS